MVLAHSRYKSKNDYSSNISSIPNRKIGIFSKLCQEYCSSSITTITVHSVWSQKEENNSYVNDGICVKSQDDTQAQPEWWKQGLWLEQDTGGGLKRTLQPWLLLWFSQLHQGRHHWYHYRIRASPLWVNSQKHTSSHFGKEKSMVWHVTLSKAVDFAADALGSYFQYLTQTFLRCLFILWTTAGPK